MYQKFDAYLADFVEFLNLMLESCIVDSAIVVVNDLNFTLFDSLIMQDPDSCKI